MKRRYIFASLLLTGFLILFGCGGGSSWDSAYCTEGADEIGVDICITVTPVDSPNVNAFTTDCNGDGKIDGDELLRDHNATAAITSTQIISNSIDPLYPITIQGYTIEYFPDSLDSPGIKDFQPLGPVNIILFIDGTLSQDIVLVDLERKGEFATDISSGRFNSNLPQRYTAVYKFFGEKFGEEFESEAVTTFTIGAFCE